MPRNRNALLSLLLFKELIGIEFPAANSSQIAYLFLKESESTLLEVIAHLLKEMEKANSEEKAAITLALTRTIHAYCSLKESEINFSKLKILYDFLRANMKSDDNEVKVMSMETVCKLINLMDIETLVVHKKDLSKLILDIVAELDRRPGGLDINNMLEEEKMKLKRVCVSTTARVLKTLDQSENSSQEFLNSILKNFEESDWESYRIVEDLLTGLMTDNERNQCLETIPSPVKQIYETLLNSLSFTMDNKELGDEKVKTIGRILKMLREIIKSIPSQTIDISIKNVIVKSNQHRNG